jgi:hypothetical protein
MSKVETALAYARRGWSVIPIAGWGDKPKRFDSSKTEDGQWKRYQHEIADEKTIRKWFSDPRTNIGLVCGKVSGLFVVDIDTAEGIEHAQRLGIDLKGDNVVKTAKGYHVYYNGNDVPNTVRAIPGIDTRGEGGYVVAPGSTTPDGKAYVWVNKTAPTRVPDVPRAVVSALSDRLITTSEKAPTVGEGGRNDRVTKEVGRLFGKGFDIHDVRTYAHAYNKDRCQPPLPYEEVETIINSIARADSRRSSTKGKRKFEVKSFEHVANTYTNDAPWLIRDWVPDATTALVVARPGSFKTWMMLDLAVSVSTGRPFLGQFPVLRTGPVILIQQEDNFGMLLDRVAYVYQLGEVNVSETQSDMTIDFTAAPNFPPIHWHVDRALRFDDAGMVESFSEVVREIKPVLVIIDPLYSAARSDDYMAQAAQDMAFMKRLRDELGTSFFVVHHAGKKSGETGRTRDDLWGSQFLNAWLETGWQLSLSKDDDTVATVNRNFKSSNNIPETVIKYEIGNGYYTPLVNQATGTDGKHDQAIYEYIINNEVSSIAAICSALGINSKSTVSASLKRLQISKDEKGFYRKC